MSDTPDLGTFEGHPVLSTAMELPSLAGGLREAIDVAGGAPIHKDEEGYLLVKFKGNKTRFDPVKDTNGYKRVDIPTVPSVAIVEGEAVERLMADHEAAVARRRAEEQRQKDEEQGTPRIPGTEPYPTDTDDDATIESDDEPWPEDPDGFADPELVPGPDDDEPEQA